MTGTAERHRPDLAGVAGQRCRQRGIFRRDQVAVELRAGRLHAVGDQSELGGQRRVGGLKLTFIGGELADDRGVSLADGLTALLQRDDGGDRRDHGEHGEYRGRRPACARGTEFVPDRDRQECAGQTAEVAVMRGGPGTRAGQAAAAVEGGLVAAVTLPPAGGSVKILADDVAHPVRVDPAAQHRP